MNVLLKTIQEDIGLDNVEVGTEVPMGVEAVLNAGEEVDEVSENLENVVEVSEKVEDVTEIQEKNMESVHENQLVSNEDGELVPVSEEEIPSVIEEQIVKENLVMESIAASLGFKSTLKSSATTGLYSLLGVNIVKPNMESKLSKKAVAINKYKSHCEGFMDAAKKLGAAVWKGIVELIRAIKEWILKLLGFKKDINTYCTQLYRRLESVKDENIELVTPTISGVSGASIVIALEYLDGPFDNAYSLFDAMTGSIHDYEVHSAQYAVNTAGSGVGGLFNTLVEVFVNAGAEVLMSDIGLKIAKRFENVKKNKLVFDKSIANVTSKGGFGYYVGNNNTYGIVVGSVKDPKEAYIRIYESDISSVEITFNNASDVKHKAMNLIKTLLTNLKTYEKLSRDVDAFMKLIDEQKFIKFDTTAPEEAQNFARKVVAEYVKGVKNIICLPNVYLAAIKQLVSMIEIKK